MSEQEMDLPWPGKTLNGAAEGPRTHELAGRVYVLTVPRSTTQGEAKAMYERLRARLGPDATVVVLTEGLELHEVVPEMDGRARRRAQVTMVLAVAIVVLTLVQLVLRLVLA